jgi:hypothetical protein
VVFILKSFRAPCHASLDFKNHRNGILLYHAWHGRFRNL